MKFVFLILVALPVALNCQSDSLTRHNIEQLLFAEDGDSRLSEDYYKNVLHSSIVLFNVYNVDGIIEVQTISLSTQDFDLLSRQSSFVYYKITKIDDPRLLFVSKGIDYCSFKKECYVIEVAKNPAKKFIAIFEPSGNRYILKDNLFTFKENLYWD